MDDRHGMHDAIEIFRRLGVKLSLTTTYNLEANGKIKLGHDPIVKGIVKSCEGLLKDSPCLLPYALWVDRTT